MSRLTESLRRVDHVMFKDGFQSSTLAEEAAKEIERLNGIATDRQYMMEAYRAMLGPVALQVVAGWDAKKVTRQHTSWGPEVLSVSGEERAMALLEAETAVHHPLNFNDSNIPQADALSPLPVIAP